MKVRLALLSVCLMLSACASKPVCPVIDPPLQRVKPLEAMDPYEPTLVAKACTWTPERWDVGLGTQADYLLVCIGGLSETLRIEVRKRETLVKWVEATP
jgi:hypothetical protein